MNDDGLLADLERGAMVTKSAPSGFGGRLAKYSQGSMPEGWKLTTDRKRLENILRALENNRGYCPCMPEHSYDTICRCKYFREGNGCHCSLYEKE